jgi:hypothetical protein
VPVDREAILAAARTALERDGSLPRTSIRPPALRDEVVEALGAEGYEVTPRFVRVPLARQLETVLLERLHLPLKGLGAHVVGATGAEAQKAALELVDAGKAHRVLRTDADTIVCVSEKVLSGSKLAALMKRLATLVEQLRRTSRKGARVGLLRADVENELASVLPAEGKDSAAPEAPSALSRILRAIDAARDERIGLSFVPRVSELLANELDAAAVKRTLLEAESRGLVELRPEGGLGRLSDREAQACPEGLHGTRLSWARRRDQVLS